MKGGRWKNEKYYVTWRSIFIGMLFIVSGCEIIRDCLHDVYW